MAMRSGNKNGLAELYDYYEVSSIFRIKGCKIGVKTAMNLNFEGFRFVLVSRRDDLAEICPLIVQLNDRSPYTITSLKEHTE